jgi:integrase
MIPSTPTPTDAQAGCQYQVLQELLGHEKAQTTMDIYSHILPGMQEKAASDFDKIANEIPIPKIRWFYSIFGW